MTTRVSARVEDQTQDPWDYFVAPPGRGTGVAVAARVDPETKHMISVIVQSGRTKFDTENDLIRSAITWFLFDKFKKYHEGKLDRGLQYMLARVQKAQHLTRIYDLEKFKNVNRDALLKMWAMGAQEDALGWYGEMLEEARMVHPKFWREIQVWVKSDPTLVDIRAAWARR